MQIVRLSDKFWEENADTPELMDKPDKRPYCCLIMRFNNTMFGIPFRHHLRHPYGFKTIGERGIDFSKAVVIKDDTYISDPDARIDRDEFTVIINNENLIRSAFAKYLRQYTRALKHKDNPRSQLLLRYSTLQYFDF